MTQFDVPAGLPILSGGGHDSPAEGACFMEYVGFLAGEKWGDSPECVCSVLTMTMQTLNDGLKDSNRSMLMPLLDRTIGLGAKPKYVTIADFKAFIELPTEERNAEHRRYDRENRQLAELAVAKWLERGYYVDRDEESMGGLDGFPSYFAGAWQDQVNSENGHDLGSAEAGEIALRMATELHEDFEKAMAELGWERNRVPQRSVDEAWEWLTWLREEPEEYTGSTMSQL